MTTTIHARFDGKVLVPEEPIDLPLNEVLTLDVRHPQFLSPLPPMAERRKAYQQVVSSAVPGGNLPDSSLRRESIYGD